MNSSSHMKYLPISNYLTIPMSNIFDTLTVKFCNSQLTKYKRNLYLQSSANNNIKLLY